MEWWCRGGLGVIPSLGPEGGVWGGPASTALIVKSAKFGLNQGSLGTLLYLPKAAAHLHYLTNIQKLKICIIPGGGGGCSLKCPKILVDVAAPSPQTQWLFSCPESFSLLPSDFFFLFPFLYIKLQENGNGGFCLLVPQNSVKSQRAFLEESKLFKICAATMLGLNF